MRVLISGFEPFGDEPVNPTQELISSINKSALLAKAIRESGVTFQAVVLPTTFAEAFVVLEKEARLFRPDVILAFGLAGGRSHAIEIERIGINVLDAKIADNRGQQPIDESIEKDGPAARFATLPIKKLVADLLEAGVPARVSNSAGTYVCNYLLFKLLGADLNDAKIGFIHVPHFPEQAVRDPKNAMTLPVLQKALATMLHSLAGTPSVARSGTPDSP